MGCSSNKSLGEENIEVKEDSFDKLEKMIKLYREAISKYKRSIEDYKDIFEQQIKCEKLLNIYFSIQKNINLSNEPNEIKNYKKTFNRVNRLEENLKIGPGIMNKFKYNNHINNQNLSDNEYDNEKDEEEDEYQKQKYKKKKRKK